MGDENKAKSFVIVCGLCYLLFLAGCALNPVYNVAKLATSGSSTTETTIPEIGKREDILDIATEVATSLGYELSMRTDLIAMFQYIKGHSRASGLLPGADTILVIDVSRVPLPHCTQEDQACLEAHNRIIAEGKWKESGVLTIRVNAHGNLGTGGEHYANSIMNEFKNRLLHRVQNG